MDIIYTILKSDGFEDFQGIKELLGPHKSHRDRSDTYQSAYKLGHLENEGPKKTIEFRQHSGTLDGERAKRWAMFCVLLVRFAQRTEVDDLIWILEKEMRLQDRTDGEGCSELKEVCRIVGLEEGLEIDPNGCVVPGKSLA